MLNAFGVKWQCDCYRTIRGERYIAWMSYPPEKLIHTYRLAGVKCRRFKDEIYIREKDTDIATAIDNKETQP